MAGLVDMNELIKRVLKYLTMGFVVAICAVLIPKKTLNVEEIVVLSLSAACIYSVLDFAIPSMGVSAIQGTGVGLGLRLSGLVL